MYNIVPNHAKNDCNNFSWQLSLHFKNYRYLKNVSTIAYCQIYIMSIIFKVIKIMLYGKGVHNNCESSGILTSLHLRDYSILHVFSCFKC